MITAFIIFLIVIAVLASAVTGWYMWLMSKGNSPAQVAVRHMALTKRAAKLYGEGRIEEGDLLMETAESLIPTNNKEYTHV